MAGYNGIAWQSLQLPFAAGLNQKTDDRARPQPFLDICRDVQFDEVGGLQVRFPYDAAAGSIFGGGTIANARRIVEYGAERLLFTSDALYSWNAQLSKWVLRATHLAVKVDERPVFGTTGDQVDGDRAELSGTVVFAWVESTTVYAAAIDKTTLGVLVAPTAVSTAVGRPRLVALATKILLFVDAGSNNLTVRSIDPAAPGTAIAGAGTTVLATNYNSFYDVVKVGGQDLCVGACRRVTTTSYTAFTVTPALVVATSTKARTCDGPIAVATIAAGTSTQVVRGNGTNIQGDLLTTSSLADVFTAQAIGTVASTPVNQITAAFVGSTATAIWVAGETTNPAGDFVTKVNTVTTANVVGTQANLVRMLGIASRAFTGGGSVYVWLAFASLSNASGVENDSGIRAQLQNTYFLYRSDGTLVSKAIFDSAGGFAPSTGRLPGVESTSDTGLDFAWCGTARRVIDLGGLGHTGFGARSPRDITFSFDSNEARRCAQIGNTLYVSGGLLMQYDGSSLTEVGFQIYPCGFAALNQPAGSIDAGVHAYKVTLRWTNARGEQERSTTATGLRVTAAAASKNLIATLSLNVTLKAAAQIAPAIEIWRTATAPNADSPFFLVTSKDPTALAGDNRYIPNDVALNQNPAVATVDNFTDAVLTTKEPNPENGAVLESLAPPGASIVIATDTRLFLARVAGQPDRVWYSRLRGDGEIASFHDILAIDVPRDGGDITSIAVFDDTLIVFRETAIYALPGVGLDNLGQGQNFGPARIASLDVGAVSHEAVAITPVGLLFKSRKGWQVLAGNGSVQYVGDKVADFDSETVHSVSVVETQHQVRILTSSRMIVWDYRVGQWGEWTIADGVHACMFGGVHVYLAATGTRSQLATYTDLTYGLDVETTWVNPGVLVADAQNGRSSAGQSEGYVRKLQPLGEYRSAHLLRFRIAYNYLDSYVDDKIWTPSPTTVGGPLQVKHGPKRHQCQAIKLRLTAVAAGASATLTTAGGIVDDLITTSVLGLWSAVLTTTAVGEAGNVVTISIGFEPGTPGVDVRDHFRWVHATQTWIPAINNVGILITLDTLLDPVTIEQLEDAIDGSSDLCTVTTNDPTSPSIDAVPMLAQVEVTGSFSGGTYTSPTGEALKLTGLGVEAGIDPGLFRRLPAAQKQ